MVRTALLIEDSVGDVFLMKESVKKANWPVELDVVTDGEQALDYLEGFMFGIVRIRICHKQTVF